MDSPTEISNFKLRNLQWMAKQSDWHCMIQETRRKVDAYFEKVKKSGLQKAVSRTLNF
jgi:hypothetical protein